MAKEFLDPPEHLWAPEEMGEGSLTADLVVAVQGISTWAVEVGVCLVAEVEALLNVLVLTFTVEVEAVLFP